MKFKDETKVEVRDILRRVRAQEVPVRWRSSERREGAGERRSKQRGRGDDFDGARPYMQGDDTRKIDWRRYAATGELLVQQFRRTTEIKAFVLADVGPTTSFGTARATKRRLVAELAAGAIASLDETKDRVGLALFAPENLASFQKPGPADVRMRFKAVASILDAQPVEGSGNGLAKALRRLPTSRSLVFIISDFARCSEQDWEALNRVGRRHDVICFFVQDARERELPEAPALPGPLNWLNRFGYFYTLTDPSGEERTIWVTKKTRALYADNFRKHEAAVIEKLKNAYCRHLIVDTKEGDDAVPRIMKLLRSARP